MTAKLSRKAMVATSARTTLVRGIGLFANFMLMVAIGQLYGADVTGLYSIGLIFLMVASALSMQGLGMALVRFASADCSSGEQARAMSRFRWALAKVGRNALLGSFCLAILAWPVANLVFHDSRLAAFVAIMGLGLIPYVAVEIGARFAQAMDQPALSMLLGYVAIPGVSAVAIALLAINGITTVNTVPTAFAAAGITTALIVYTYLWPWSNGHAALEVSHRTEMRRVGWPLLWSEMAGMMLGWADTIMLGAIAGATEAGIYAVAFRVAIFSSIARQIAARVAIGRFAAAIARKDEREQQRLLAFITHVGLVAALPIAILAFVFPEFVLGLAGEEFKGGALVLSVIVAGELVSLVFGSPGAALQVSGHHQVFSRLVWVALALNIALNALLIPIYGALGAAVATAITGLLQKSIMAVLVIRLTGSSTLAIHSALRVRRMATQTIPLNQTAALREETQ